MADADTNITLETFRLDLSESLFVLETLLLQTGMCGVRLRVY